MSASDLILSLANQMECKQGSVRAVRFNVNGNYCMTAGSDKTVKLWNPYKSVLLKTYTGAGWEVLDVRSSSDNSTILAGGLDKHLMVHDVETGKVLRRWRGHNGKINCVSFNEQATVALSGSQDGCIRCFDMRDRSGPIQTMNEATDAILSMDVCSHNIVSGSADGHFRIYNVRDGKVTIDYVGESVTSVCFSGDGQCTLISTNDGIVRLFDNANGQLLSDYTGHTNRNYRVESGLLSTEAHVVSGSEDGNVFVWNLLDMSISQRLKHPSSIVHSVSVHPLKPVLVSASSSAVYLWAVDESED